MRMLRFKDEEQMYEVLGDVPHSPFGVVRVRGELGVCGQYEETGEAGADGTPVLRELVAPVIYDGYFAELMGDEPVPVELEEFVHEPE